MKTRKVWTLVTLVALFAMLAVACAPPTPEKVVETVEVTREVVVTATPEPTPAPKYGGKLTMAVPGDAVALDPAHAWTSPDQPILSNVFEALTRLDEDWNVLPSLAESWEQKSETEYIFKIRKGVKFHNGREMTVEDVKYSIDRILDPDTASRRQGYIVQIDKVEVVDPDHIRITLQYPFAPMLTYMSEIFISPPEEEETIGEKPVGTGPFMFMERVPDEYTILKKFPDYWEEGLPHLDEIELKVIPDPETRLINLEQGRVDVIMEADLKDVERLQQDPNIVVERATGDTSFYVFWMNCTTFPFNDEKLRNVVAYALDKEAIHNQVFFGLSDSSKSNFPKTHWAYDPAIEDYGYKYDPQKAKELMAEAGYPDGFDVEIMATATYPEFLTVSEILQANLRDIGINATIDERDWPAWLEKFMPDKGYQICLTTNTPHWDPDSFIARNLHSERAGRNRMGFTDPELDRLLDEGILTTDLEKRKQAYFAVDRFLVDHVPLIIVHRRPLFYAESAKVQGLWFNSRGFEYMRETWLEE
jgi:peptide/nickel transport system substrate-binding protein